jgi:hypothetical protein
MMKMKRLTFLAVLALAAGGTGFADNWDQDGILNDSTALSTTNELVHGSVQIHDLDSTNSGVANDQDWFFLSFRPYSSYEVVVDATTPFMNNTITPLDLDLVLADGTLVLASKPISSKGLSRSLRFSNASAGPQDQTWFRVSSAVCNGFCDTRDTYQIRAYDTTYRVARFNNSATQVTVLIVENPTDSPVLLFAWFFNASGGLITSTSPTIPPHGIYSVNTSTVAPGASGSIAITNDAPYGALTGKAVAVEPATGFAFDTVMMPRVN